MKARILLVEDDRALAGVMASAIQAEGYELVQCASISERDRLLESGNFDVMLTDVVLQDGDGLASLESVRACYPAMSVIVLSAQNSLETAVRASEADAFEYFPKPFDIDELVRAIVQACGRNKAGAPAPSAQMERLPLIGRSPPMQAVFRMITRVLNNDLTVLITGESGTGKELVAEAIHQLGARKSGPFIAVNAAAIPAALIESELFGHEKGAFTGAIAQAIGKFEQANGGTLFLDEIGDMPSQAQTRLLRALQSGRIRRVGGRHEIAIDVRVIAATNRDLAPMIEAGSFREDLYYRLNVVPIELPPLRDRPGDIAVLARHFLEEAARKGLPHRRLDKGALAVLESRRWKGNVRELRNAMHRLCVMARDETIDAQTLRTILGAGETAPDKRSEAGFAEALASWLDGRQLPEGALYQAALAAFEKPLFEFALARTGGNQLRAAKLLGINRNTLRKRIELLGIGRKQPANR